MIKSLRLEEYGKFKAANLDFGPFTLVYGANEAGKTTVFDALFEQVCASAPRRGEVWTRLAARYGEARKASASGEVQKFGDAVQFLELFAVRAGALSVEAEEGDSWAEAAKNSLYRHGFNPAELAEALEKRVSANNATRHQKQLNAVTAELAEVRGKIEELKGRETAAGAAREKLTALDAGTEAAAKRSSDLETEQAALSARLEGFKLSRKLHACLQDRDLAAAAVHGTRHLEELSSYSPEALKEYDELVRKLDDARRAADETAGSISARNEALAKLEAAADEMAVSKEAADRCAALAAELIPEVNKLIAAAALPPPAPTGKAARYAAFAGCALAAAAGFYLGRSSAFWYLLLPLAAAGAFFAHRKLGRLSAVVAAAQAPGLGFVYDRWVNSGYERADIQRDTPAGVQEALINIKGQAAGWEVTIENNKKEGEAAREELKKLQEAAAALAADAEKIAAEARGWLEKAGCKTRDEFLARAGRREGLGGELASREVRLKELLLTENASSPGALLALLDARVKELEVAGVKPRPDAERDIAADERKLSLLTQELKEAGAALTARKVERENYLVAFTKDLAKVPEELNALRRRELELEEAIETDALARAGAALAAQIYREIEADSSRRFAALAKAVEGYLGRVIPVASLEISGPAADAVSARDAGGELRPLDHLSTGTRDCFMLAARLCMAAEARGAEPGLLLLDEPFPSLDPVRRAHALNLLKAFGLEKNWQVILFTKDRALLLEVEKDPQVTVCKLS